MDSQIKANQNSVKTLFEEIGKLGNFTPEQKESLYSDLDQAIQLNIVMHVVDSLPKEQQEVIKTKKFKNGDELYVFLSDAIPQEKLRAIVGDAMLEVVNQFLDNISK